MADDAAQSVIALVCSLKPGTVVTYGMVGAVLGIGPRHVGRIMSQHGSQAPWWRVVRADGSIHPSLLAEAKTHWLEEGLVVRCDKVELARNVGGI